MESRELTAEESQRLQTFFYHRVAPDTLEEMGRIRAHYYALATRIMVMLPESRAKALALTALEESSMRTIQALAMSGELLPMVPIESERRS